MEDYLKVLIIEDERIPASYLKSIIEEDSDFKVVDIVESATKALESVKKYHPEIVFVDIMIKGGISGAEFALKLHNLYENTVIIFLTAFSDEEMVDYATEADAFAYLLKPYRPNEIKATLSLVKAKLKNTSKKPELLTIVKLPNGYKFNLENDTLQRDNEIVKLPPKEFNLLKLLCHNRGKTLSKDAILNMLEITDTSLRSLIYRLRKHLGENVIESSKKFGYKVIVEDEV